MHSAELGSIVSNEQLPKMKGGCDLSAYDVPCNDNHENATMQMPFPPERMAEMKAYASKLRKKFPHMKSERLGKKVAEYFKVKLT